VLALTTKLDTTPAVERVRAPPMTSDTGLNAAPACHNQIRRPDVRTDNQEPARNAMHAGVDGRAGPRAGSSCASLHPSPVAWIAEPRRAGPRPFKLGGLPLHLVTQCGKRAH
jgi:hypothetical protein